jgi:hypothetical protein
MQILQNKMSSNLRERHWKGAHHQRYNIAMSLPPNGKMQFIFAKA